MSLKECKGKQHLFPPTGRKCYCGKADIYWFKCERCGVNNVSKVHGVVCKKCLNDPKYKGEVAKDMKKYDNIHPEIYGRYKEATAFGYDKKTGQYLAIDKKGRKFDPSRTRYDFTRDPHGWKATGKKPRKTDKYGRFMSD